MTPGPRRCVFFISGVGQCEGDAGHQGAHVAGGPYVALEGEQASILPSLPRVGHAACRRRVGDLERENDRLRSELRIIAEADPSKWDPDMRDQFREWAQNRARDAASKGGT